MFKRLRPKSKKGSVGRFLEAAHAGNRDRVSDFIRKGIDVNATNEIGVTGLHLAAKEGHVDVVGELVKHGARVDAATRKGITALHVASLSGRVDVIRLLLDNGTKINIQSKDGFTPLYMAAQENHVEAVRCLLSSGASQSLTTEDGFTALSVALQQGHDDVARVLLGHGTSSKLKLPQIHIATKKGDLRAVALLLRRDEDNINTTSKSGFTPLHIAAHYGNTDMGRLLIGKGADVNFRARNGISPLHVASKRGRLSLVSLLIDSGADVNNQTKDGISPLHCAVINGGSKVVGCLLQRGASFDAKTRNGFSALHLAVQGDHVNCVKQLLQHGAPINDVSTEQLTPLHVAAHCGNVRSVRLLLEKKCEINPTAMNGFTPLHIAAKRNHREIVELLIKHGAKVDARTQTGLTPLHVAAFMGHSSVVSSLLRLASNPDCTTSNGDTALHFATRNQHVEVIDQLLHSGSQVDSRAADEVTPLHIAIQNGDLESAALLLHHGATPSAKTSDLNTPLHFTAAASGKDDVTQLLLEHGASPAVANKKGLLPLHVAAKHGNVRVARLLLARSGVDPSVACGNGDLTPLHMAVHCNQINTALLLLERGAKPNCQAKNGYTALHVAAAENRMNLVPHLLEHGANINAESQTGFTPLHLSSKAGHLMMTALLLERGANVDHASKDGLTPMHLVALGNRVPLAEILLQFGANINAETNSGLRPVHLASQLEHSAMVEFLLGRDAEIGRVSPSGQVSISSSAERLSNDSAVDLQAVSSDVLARPFLSTGESNEDQWRILSEDDQHSANSLPDATFRSGVSTSTYNIPDDISDLFAFDLVPDPGCFEGQRSLPNPCSLIRQEFVYTREDRGDLATPDDHHQHHHHRQAATLHVEPQLKPSQESSTLESTVEPSSSAAVSNNLTSCQQSCMPSPPEGGRPTSTATLASSFLFSFLVDARGGAMQGSRCAGIRVIVPPDTVCMPTRITCRYVRKERLLQSPALSDGEGLAARVLEMGPDGIVFSGPVAIEVSHFASLQDGRREVIVLRSDNGQKWCEHTTSPLDNATIESLCGSSDESVQKVKIITDTFPRYFALISRFRHETATIGPEGGTLTSKALPDVRAIFPPESIKRSTKVQLQVNPADDDLLAKVLGSKEMNRSSPVVTIDPRHRRFHQPIALTIPLPKSMNDSTDVKRSSLRVFSSRSEGNMPAVWEDITDAIAMTILNGSATLLVTVSARFWLIDSSNKEVSLSEVTELYQETLVVPFWSKFLVFAKRLDGNEARVRLFSVTDDQLDKTLDNQEGFAEVARSEDVVVFDGKPIQVELTGNLLPQFDIKPSSHALSINFHAFRENRLPFSVKIQLPEEEPSGQVSLIYRPKSAPDGSSEQKVVCVLGVKVPDLTSAGVEEQEKAISTSALKSDAQISKAELHLTDIADILDADWLPLAVQLGLTQDEVSEIQMDYDYLPEQALIMLHQWVVKHSGKATGNHLERALKQIGRADVIAACMHNISEVTDDRERVAAKNYIKDSDSRDELASPRFLGSRSSRDSSARRRRASSDVSYGDISSLPESRSFCYDTGSEVDSETEKEEYRKAPFDDQADDHCFYVDGSINSSAYANIRSTESEDSDAVLSDGASDLEMGNSYDRKDEWIHPQWKDVVLRRNKDEARVMSDATVRLSQASDATMTPEDIEESDRELTPCVQDMVSTTNDTGQHTRGQTSISNGENHSQGGFLRHPDAPRGKRMSTHPTMENPTMENPTMENPTGSHTRGADSEGSAVVWEVTEGDIFLSTDVSDLEETLGDGTRVKRRTTTRKQMRPVEEKLVRGRDVLETRTKDEVVRIEVEEDITELEPGIEDEFGAHLDCETTSEEFEEMLDDGVVILKKVTRVRVRRSVSIASSLSDWEIEGGPVGKNADAGDVDENILTRHHEGRESLNGSVVSGSSQSVMVPPPVHTPPVTTWKESDSDTDATVHRLVGEVFLDTEEGSEEGISENGVKTNRKITTIRHILPITEITRSDRGSTVSKKFEIIGTEIEEEILETAPGMEQSPYFDLENGESETSVEESEETMPDGTWIKKKTTWITVTPRDSNQLYSNPLLDAGVMSKSDEQTCNLLSGDANTERIPLLYDDDKMDESLSNFRANNNSKMNVDQAAFSGGNSLESAVDQMSFSQSNDLTKTIEQKDHFRTDEHNASTHAKSGEFAGFTEREEHKKLKIAETLNTELDKLLNDESEKQRVEEQYSAEHGSEGKIKNEEAFAYENYDGLSKTIQRQTCESAKEMDNVAPSGNDMLNGKTHNGDLINTCYQNPASDSDALMNDVDQNPVLEISVNETDHNNLLDSEELIRETNQKLTLGNTNLNDGLGNTNLNDGLKNTNLNDVLDNTNLNDGLGNTNLNDGLGNTNLNDGLGDTNLNDGLGNDNTNLNDGLGNTSLNDGVGNTNLIMAADVKVDVVNETNKIEIDQQKPTESEEIIKTADHHMKTEEIIAETVEKAASERPTKKIDQKAASDPVQQITISEEVIEKTVRNPADAENQILKAEPAHVESEIKEAKQKPAHVESQIKEVEQKPAHVESQIEEAEQKPAHVECQIKEVEQKPAHIERQIKEVEQKPAHVESQIEEAKQKLAHVESQIEEAEQKPALVECQIKEVEQKPAHVESQIKEVEQKPTHVESQIKEVEQKPTHVESQIKEVEQKPAHVESQIEEAEQKPAHVECQIEEAEQKPAHVECQIKGAEQVPAYVESQIKEVEQKPSHVESKITEAEKTPAHVEIQIKKDEQKPAHVESQMKVAEQVPAYVENQIKEAEQKPTHVESQIKEAKQKPAHVESQIKEAKQKPAHVESQIKEVEQKPAHVESQIKEAEQKPAHVESQIKEAEQKPAHVESQIKEVEQKPAIVENQIKEVEQNPAHVESQSKGAEQVPAHVKSQIKEAEQKPGHAEGQIKKAEQKPAIFESQIKEVGQKPAHVESQIKEVKQKPAHVESQIKEVEQKPAHVESQIKEVEQKPAHVESQIKEVEQKPAHVESQIKEVEQKPAHVESQIKEAKQKPAHVESQIKEVEQKPAHVESQIKEAKQKPAHVESQIKEVEQKPAHFESQIKETEQTLAHVESQIKGAEQVPAHVEGQIQEAEQIPAYVKSQIQEAEQKPAHVESQIKKDEQKPAHVESQIKEAEQKPAHVESQIKKDEQKPAHVESQIREAEQKPAHVEIQIRKDEQKPDDDESQIKEVEQVPAYVESQIKETEQKPDDAERLMIVIDNETHLNTEDSVEEPNRKKPSDVKECIEDSDIPLSVDTTVVINEANQTALLDSQKSKVEDQTAILDSQTSKVEVDQQSLIEGVVIESGQPPFSTTESRTEELQATDSVKHPHVDSIVKFKTTEKVHGPEIPEYPELSQAKRENVELHRTSGAPVSIDVPQQVNAEAALGVESDYLLASVAEPSLLSEMVLSPTESSWHVSDPNSQQGEDQGGELSADFYDIMQQDEADHLEQTVGNVENERIVFSSDDTFRNRAIGAQKETPSYISERMIQSKLVEMLNLGHFRHLGYGPETPSAEQRVSESGDNIQSVDEAQLIGSLQTQFEPSEVPMGHDFQFEPSEVPVGYDFQFEPSEVPVGNDVQFEPSEVPVGHDFQFEPSEVPVGDDVQFEPSEVPVGHDFQFESSEVPVGHDVQFEPSEVPVEHDFQFEPSEVPMGHDFQFDPSEMPVGHDFQFEPSEVPAGHDFQFGSSEISRGHDFQFEPSEVPVGHDFQFEPSEVPVGHDVQFEPSEVPVEHDFQFESSEVPMVLDPSEVPVGHDFQFEPSEVPAGHDFQFGSSEIPRGHDFQFEPSEVPVGHDFQFEPSEVPVGHDFQFEPSEVPVGHDFQFEPSEVHVGHDFQFEPSEVHVGHDFQFEPSEFIGEGSYDAEAQELVAENGFGDDRFNMLPSDILAKYGFRSKPLESDASLGLDERPTRTDSFSEEQPRRSGRYGLYTEPHESTGTEDDAFNDESSSQTAIVTESYDEPAATHHSSTESSDVLAKYGFRSKPELSTGYGISGEEEREVAARQFGDPSYISGRAEHGDQPQSELQEDDSETKAGTMEAPLTPTSAAPRSKRINFSRPERRLRKASQEGSAEVLPVTPPVGLDRQLVSRSPSSTVRGGFQSTLFPTEHEGSTSQSNTRFPTASAAERDVYSPSSPSENEYNSPFLQRVRGLCSPLKFDKEMPSLTSSSPLTRSVVTPDGSPTRDIVSPVLPEELDISAPNAAVRRDVCSPVSWGKDALPPLPPWRNSPMHPDACSTAPTTKQDFSWSTLPSRRIVHSPERRREFRSSMSPERHDFHVPVRRDVRSATSPARQAIRSRTSPMRQEIQSPASSHSSWQDLHSPFASLRRDTTSPTVSRVIASPVADGESASRRYRSPTPPTGRDFSFSGRTRRRSSRESLSDVPLSLPRSSTPEYSIHTPPMSPVLQDLCSSPPVRYDMYSPLQSTSKYPEGVPDSPTATAEEPDGRPRLTRQPSLLQSTLEAHSRYLDAISKIEEIAPGLMPNPALMGPDVTQETIKGKIRCSTSDHEDPTVETSDRTIMKKSTVIQYFQPVVCNFYRSGILIDSRNSELMLGKYVDDFIYDSPSDLTNVSDLNNDNTTSVDVSEETLADGTWLKHKTTRVVVGPLDEPVESVSIKEVASGKSSAEDFLRSHPSLKASDLLPLVNRHPVLIPEIISRLGLRSSAADPVSTSVPRSADTYRSQNTLSGKELVASLLAERRERENAAAESRKPVALSLDLESGKEIYGKQEFLQGNLVYTDVCLEAGQAHAEGFTRSAKRENGDSVNVDVGVSRLSAPMLGNLTFEAINGLASSAESVHHSVDNTVAVFPSPMMPELDAESVKDGGKETVRPTVAPTQFDPTISAQIEAAFAETAAPAVETEIIPADAKTSFKEENSPVVSGIIPPREMPTESLSLSSQLEPTVSPPLPGKTEQFEAASGREFELSTATTNTQQDRDVGVDPDRRVVKTTVKKSVKRKVRKVRHDGSVVDLSPTSEPETSGSPFAPAFSASDIPLPANPSCSPHYNNTVEGDTKRTAIEETLTGDKSRKVTETSEEQIVNRTVGDSPADDALTTNIAGPEFHSIVREPGLEPSEEKLRKSEAGISPVPPPSSSISTVSRSSASNESSHEDGSSGTEV